MSLSATQPTVDPSPEGPVLPGQLGIRMRRSWPTWMLVTGILAGVLLGMVVGHTGSSGTSETAQTSYTPPPPSGSATSAPTTTSPSAPATAGASGQATTTTAAATGTAQVLVPRFESSQASWTSRVFTIAGGTWNIGWAYRCTPAPAGGSAFTVTVLASGATSPKPAAAVSEAGASGQSVTPQSSTGAQSIEVTAAPGCLWVIQVTGIGS